VTQWASKKQFVDRFRILIILQKLTVAIDIIKRYFSEGQLLHHMEFWTRRPSVTAAVLSC